MNIALDCALVVIVAIAIGAPIRRRLANPAGRDARLIAQRRRALQAIPRILPPDTRTQPPFDWDDEP